MCPNSCEATGQLTLYPTGGDNYGISDKQPRSGNDGDVGAQNLGAATASERGMAATSAGPSRTGPSPVRRCWVSACGVTAHVHCRQIPRQQAPVALAAARLRVAPTASAGVRRWHSTSPLLQPQSPPRLSAGVADCARLRHRRRRNRQGTPAACRARHRHQVHPM